MKRAKHTRPLTISVSPDVYEHIKKITDEKEISIAEWFRDLVDQELTRGDLESTRIQ